MLPDATVPCSLAELLTVFRPCLTAAIVRTFIGLLSATVSSRPISIWLGAVVV